mgnify:CR=1 FL=1
MGVAYSDQKTKWSQNDPTTAIKTIEQGGRIRIAYGSFTAATEQSDIQMFNLPNGARILDGEVGHAAYTNSAGTAVAADVDEYKAAAASTSITTVGCALTAALGKNSIVDANEDGIPITVSLAGADGAGLIELTMYYVLD